MAEPRLLPDVDLMKELCDEVFGELLQLAAEKSASEEAVH
jgi:hypothetical protein